MQVRPLEHQLSILFPLHIFDSPGHPEDSLLFLVGLAEVVGDASAAGALAVNDRFVRHLLATQDLNIVVPLVLVVLLNRDRASAR